MIKPSGINTKIHIVGSLLSFIIVGIIVLTVIMNDRSIKDSLIINIAGKQRMLTQKMSKEIFYIKHKQSIDFRELNTALNLFDNNLQDLLRGNDAQGIYAPQDRRIQAKLEEVLALWKPFKAEVLKIENLSKEIQPKLQVLTERTTQMLNISDRVVKEMVAAGLEGRLIDLSGRQRMLTQRMGLFLERYLRTDNEEDFLLFAKARMLYDETIKSFKAEKSVQAEPKVMLVVEKAHEQWENHLLLIDDILKVEEQISDALVYIYEENIKLLNTMDMAVWLYTEYSEKKNALFVKVQYISLIIALLIMGYSYLLSREIVQHIKEFVKRTKALESGDISSLTHETIELEDDSEDELKEASGYLANYVKKVNVAMNHSEDAIKKAESAIKELQNLTDDVENTLNELDLDDSEKKSFDKKVNDTEDIAIESAENLLHVRKMLEKLQNSLNIMVENSQK